MPRRRLASVAAGDELRDLPEDRGRGRALRLLVRLLVVGVLVGWLAFFADVEKLASTFARMPPSALAGAGLLAIGVVVIGGIRWRVLMGAFGPRDPPTIPTTVRLFFVGLFYNTFVPGSVGGDVVRGVVTRHCFERRAASYVVVLLERLIGLSALGLVFLVGLAVGPDIVGLRARLPWLAVLLLVGIATLALALMTQRLSRTIRALPELQRKRSLVWVFGLSLLSHLSGITATWVLADGMGLSLPFGALLLVMPIAFTAAALPVNVLGIGAREVSLVALLGLLGVEAERALALSLAYGLLFLALAAVGGLLQLVQGRVGGVGAPGARAAGGEAPPSEQGEATGPGRGAPSR